MNFSRIRTFPRRGNGIKSNLSFTQYLVGIFRIDLVVYDKESSVEENSNNTVDYYS